MHRPLAVAHLLFGVRKLCFLLPPAHAHVERTFAGPDGTWTAHVLTRKHAHRAAVVDLIASPDRDEPAEAAAAATG